MTSNLNRTRNKTFLVWFSLLSLLFTSNYLLPEITRIIANASNCYTTENNANYGYSPTGRPCPNPKIVATMPYAPTNQHKGILPTQDNIEYTDIPNTVLYISTLPVYVFALITIVGTIFIWAIFQFKSKTITPSK